MAPYLGRKELTMDIYVQSRGFEQDYDYRWLQIYRDGSSKRQVPPLSPEVINLIDSDTPSVVLERLDAQRLLLLVTGIEPDGRIDFLGRQIRISLAWLGVNSDEYLLRKLAVRILKSDELTDFTTEINQAIIFGGEEGFQACLENMQKITKLTPEELSTGKPPDLTKKIGSNSVKLRNQLALELQQSCLPTETGSLVVVTGLQEREILENAQVWRSLSTLVESEDWQEIASSTVLSVEDIWQNMDYQDILKRPFWLANQLLSYRQHFLAYLLALLKEALSLTQKESKSENDLGKKP
ncbi:MAG: hypothetical protein WA919_04805 [Coleofasciculaceae cyanobacterium]